MTRRFTGLCIAGAFAFAASAAAQSTTTTAPQSSSTPGHEVSVTGCLAKSGDGTYMLTSARVEPAGSASATTTTGSSTTTTGSSTTTAGTTATGTSGTATTTAPSNAGAAGRMTAATWVLQGGTDLDKHVGHKVTVTGNATWNPPSGAAANTTGGAATGTTAGATTAGSAVGTSGATTTAGTTGEQRAPSSSADRMSNSNPRLNVESVKMIASSCS